MTRAGLLAAGAAFVLSFIFYSFTAARDLTLVDSGELALACETGSVPHPPGFPLFYLVGRAACLVSPASPIRTMNLLSACFVAASVAFVFLLVERMLACLTALARRPASPRTRLLAAAVAAAAWATARNPWTWAGVTEVYALNIALTAAAWAFGWAACASVATREGNVRLHAILAAAAAAAGLANHHATALVAAPPLLALALLAAPSILRARWFWIASAASVAASLALYLVLIVAGRAERGLDWGGIRDVGLLVRHVLGRQYHVQFARVPGETELVAREFAGELLQGPGLPAALVVLVGVPLALAFLRRAGAIRAALAFPLIAIAANLALSVAYVVGPEDRVAYDLPAHLAWCALTGLGAWGIVARVGRAGLLAPALGLVLAAWNIVRNAGVCDFREERVARTFVEETLRDVPDRGVVLAAEWNFVAPYLYMREVEGYRPGVRVIDILMMRRFWYLATVERTMPDLVAKSRPEFDAFKEQVTLFDLGRPYDQARIQTLYEDLLRRWMEIGIEEGAGAWFDWACATRNDEASWVQSVQGVPDQLLIRVLAPRGATGDATAGVELAPLDPMDVENLRWIRSKVPSDDSRLDLGATIPRHVQYWKVLTTYRRSLESAIVYTLLRGDGARAEAIREEARGWYPNVDGVWASARARAGR